MDSKTALLTPSHHDLSRTYGCAATMTVVSFIVHGLVHRARRFWRSDMPLSGKIELYTVQPFPGADATTMSEAGWYASTLNEDFFRYVDRANPCAVDDIAIAAIGGVYWARVNLCPMLAQDQEARFALLELV